MRFGSWSPARAACVAAWIVLPGAGVAYARQGPASASTAPPARDTRLFVGPTARALDAGEGYFILHGGFVPAFQVGLTNRVSLGAGTFYGNSGNFWVTPKVQFLRRESASLAATVLHFTVPSEGHLGLAFLSATRDTARGGLTFGIGAAYSSGWNEEDAWAVGGPLIMIGGDRRLSRRVTFVSENYTVISSDGGAMLFNGVRASWTRFSLDAALVAFVGPGGAAGGPFFNLAWRF